MFQKLNRHSIHKHFNTAKRLISSGYNTATSFLGDIDVTLKYGKQIYGIVKPILEEITNTNLSGIDKTLIKGLNTYENVRNRVVDADTKAHDIAYRIKSIK